MELIIDVQRYCALCFEIVILFNSDCSTMTKIISPVATLIDRE